MTGSARVGRERERKVTRGNERASTHARRALLSHARIARTHASARIVSRLRKPACEKLANGEQRRESVGSPTWFASNQSARHRRRISSWFPARRAAFAFARERDGREKKISHGSARASERRATNSRMEERERASGGSVRKEEERTSLHRVLTPPSLRR